MAEAARRPVARIVSVFAPGVPQLVSGRWGVGGAALTVWLWFGWIALSRPGRLGAAFSGTFAERLAAATVLAGLATTWVWSWRTTSRARAEGKDRPSGRWTQTLASFSRSPVGVFGAVAVLLLCLLAVVAPLLAPFDPIQPGMLPAERLIGPSMMHLMGTDQAARDVYSRLLYGARISLGIGLLAVLVSSIVGTLVGAAAGYLGGWIDGALMRFVDLVISFPRLVLLLAIAAVFEPSVPLIILVLGLTLWPTTARIVRGEVLAIRGRAYVEAARSLGYSRRRIILGHVIPNVFAPVIVAATLGIGDTIVLEAGLSFLGLGVQPPMASWGTMVADGRNGLANAWWLSTFPGLAIAVTVLAFNLVGDGLRDAHDPRTRR